MSGCEGARRGLVVPVLGSPLGVVLRRMSRSSVDMVVW
jgi:hypothetical protein